MGMVRGEELFVAPSAGLRLVGGMGMSLDPDAESLIALMSPAPSGVRQRHINDLVLGLKETGVWSALDELWVFAAHSAQAGLLGWKQYKDCTNVGDTPHTSDRGFQRDSGTKYLNTNFVPSTDGVNYTLNNMSFGVWSLTDGAIATIDMGSRNTSSAQQALMQIKWSDGDARYRSHINGSAGSIVITTPDARGLFVVRRTNSNNFNAFRNGKIITSIGTSSTSMPAHAMTIGALNTAGTISDLSTRQYAAAFIARGMADTQQTALYELLRTYLIAVGAEDARTGIYWWLPLDRSANLAQNNSQGVAYDGTYYYFSDSTRLYKYTRDPETNVYTEVQVRLISGDFPSGMTQANGMNFHNGSLWIGGNNFSTEPKVGWIFQYNPANLTKVATLVTDPHWSEGGAWKDVGAGDELWVHYHDWDRVTRYNASLEKVDDYLMPLIEGLTNEINVSGLYQGAAWWNNLLFTQTHAINVDTATHIHAWNGTGFDQVQIIPAFAPDAGQGIHWETPGDVMLFACRVSGGVQSIVRARLMTN